MARSRESIIRYSGFIPLAFLFGAISIYVIFFFDAHLRRLLEFALTSLNGAKVDVASLSTSLLDCSFEVRGIEITSPTTPMKNRATINRVYYQVLFRPLFQKKFVIREASVTGIQWGTHRKVSGFIPAPPPKPKTPGFMDQALERLETEVSKKAGETSISQLAEFSENPSFKVQKLGEDSHSFKKIKALETELGQASSQWQNEVTTLADTRTLDGIKSRLEALSRERPSRPDEIIMMIKTADQLKGDAEAHVKSVVDVQKHVTDQISSFGNSLSSVDTAISADIDTARKLLKVPSIDFKDITPALLGPKIYGYFREALYWAELSRKYLPKKSKDVTRVEQKRARGTDIHFAGFRSLPTFLLELAAIESNVTSDSRAGNVRGEIRGLNSNPPVYGKPTVFQITGDFPAARISGAEINITIDHVSENATETGKIILSSFPIEDAIFSSDPAATFGIESASAKAAIQIGFSEKQVDARLQATVAGIRYKSSFANASIDKAITRILGSLSAFDLAAYLRGSPDGLDFGIRSDLGEKLAEGFTSEFKAQIGAINERIKKSIEADIREKKATLLATLESEKQKALAPVEERLKQARAMSQSVDVIKTRLGNEKNRLAKQAEDEARAQATDRARQEAEKIKKSIKLPGV